MFEFLFKVLLVFFYELEAEVVKYLSLPSPFFSSPVVFKTRTSHSSTLTHARSHVPVGHSPLHSGPSVFDFLAHSAVPVDIFALPSGVPWDLRGEFSHTFCSWSTTISVVLRRLVGHSPLHSGFKPLELYQIA